MFWIVLLNNNLRTFWGWFVIKHPINKNSISLTSEIVCSYMRVFTVWHTGQERMGPSKERSAGQRNFLSLTLIWKTLYLASILKILATCDQATFFFLLPDSTTRHLRVVVYYYRSVSLQWSIASLVKRPFYFWDKDTVELSRNLVHDAQV